MKVQAHRSLKIPERFIFVSILVLGIFAHEVFVYKFKLQFLSRDISRTIANIAIIFSATQTHIKTITFEKFYCCRDAPVNCLLQFFCHYFSDCCSYFSTLRFLFTLLIFFIVTIYWSSKFC